MSQEQSSNGMPSQQRSKLRYHLRDFFHRYSQVFPVPQHMISGTFVAFAGLTSTIKLGSTHVTRIKHIGKGQMPRRMVNEAA